MNPHLTTIAGGSKTTLLFLSRSHSFQSRSLCWSDLLARSFSRSLHSFEAALSPCRSLHFALFILLNEVKLLPIYDHEEGERYKHYSLISRDIDVEADAFFTSVRLSRVALRPSVGRCGRDSHRGQGLAVREPEDQHPFPDDWR